VAATAVGTRGTMVAAAGVVVVVVMVAGVVRAVGVAVATVVAAGVVAVAAGGRILLPTASSSRPMGQHSRATVRLRARGMALLLLRQRLPCPRAVRLRPASGTNSSTRATRGGPEER
jgi:hypothetical protein